MSTSKYSRDLIKTWRSENYKPINHHLLHNQIPVNCALSLIRSFLDPNPLLQGINVARKHHVQRKRHPVDESAAPAGVARAHVGGEQRRRHLDSAQHSGAGKWTWTCLNVNWVGTSSLLLCEEYCASMVTNVWHIAKPFQLPTNDHNIEIL